MKVFWVFAVVSLIGVSAYAEKNKVGTRKLSAAKSEVPSVTGAQARAIYKAMGDAHYGVDCTNGSCRLHGKVECEKEKNPTPEKDADFSCSFEPDHDWQ